MTQGLLSLTWRHRERGKVILLSDGHPHLNLQTNDTKPQLALARPSFISPLPSRPQLPPPAMTRGP